MKPAGYLLLAVLALAGASLGRAEELFPVAHPEQLGFSPERLQRLTDTYQGYVDRGELPGAVLLIARGDKIAYPQAIGFQDREEDTNEGRRDFPARVDDQADRICRSDDAWRGRQDRPRRAGLEVH